MRVLSVASEIAPLVKTGGLADVTGALPAALAGVGVQMRSLVPGYPAVMAALQEPEAVHAFEDLFGGPAVLLQGRGAGLDLLVIDAPHLYGRPGNPYLGPDGATGRTTPNALPRWLGSGRMSRPMARAAGVRRCCTGMTGRRAS